MVQGIGMPIFQLSERIIFPPPDLAGPDGLLAVGGDLSPKRLILAYSEGIFPWYSQGQPLLWWSPDPRLVLHPQQCHVSRSLRKTIRQQRYTVTFDCAFAQVIHTCGQLRQEAGTWITTDMEQAYIQLHKMGYAHSVEAWMEVDDHPVLAGGLYGIAMGNCFFGESMFHRYPDASKVAFVHLVQRLRLDGCQMIDCQITTEHMVKFGAKEVSRQHFLEQLQNFLTQTPPQPHYWR